MTAPGYGYFEHDADIGVVGRGGTVEAAFEQAAMAMFRVMSENDRDQRTVETVYVTFQEDDLELALVTWLNDLLTTAQSRGLFFTAFHLERTGDYWSGSATGAPWPPDAEPGVEVKGATLTELSVSQHGDGWEARCVIDV